MLTNPRFPVVVFTPLQDAGHQTSSPKWTWPHAVTILTSTHRFFISIRTWKLLLTTFSSRRTTYLSQPTTVTSITAKACIYDAIQSQVSIHDAHSSYPGS